MCVPVSGYINTQCRCKLTSLVIRVPHSLYLWMFVSMFGPFVTDWTCIRTSPDQRFSLCLSLSLCLFQCPGILPVICMCMNRFVKLSQRVIALSFYLIFISWFIFLSLCLSLNVGNGVQLYYDSLYVHMRLCIVFVCVFQTGYLYYC